MFIVIAAVLITVGGLLVYKVLSPTPEEKSVNQIEFDASVTEAEKQTILNAVSSQSILFEEPTTVSIKTATNIDDDKLVLSAYVPITNVYAVRQNITSEELTKTKIYLPSDTSDVVRNGFVSSLKISQDSVYYIEDDFKEVSEDEIALAPIDQLNHEIKLLSLDDNYYLDDFASGAVFRQVEFSGNNTETLANLDLSNLPNKDSTLKVNMSGVTALTRLMMRKLSSVQDPKYFSAKIGEYLADADITHVSNEVSFQPGCQYSNTSFCSPPEFIETLKASGVDLVEITGNHNNDRGNAYNTDSINQYHELGWATFGGGLNSAEAAKPFVADQKGSKVSFLGYNMADGLGSGAIAGDTTAGANFYTDEKAQADIKAAKEATDFVIVNIQYAECQAYPSGYVEYPVCDSPIPGQEADFKQLIDFGADMVVGSSAHQPQTYELYKNKPIFYGLGNMYFDQYQWPGTERGIILTHYFVGGQLVQTKLLVTDFDENLQTRTASAEESSYLLERLNAAR